MKNLVKTRLFKPFNTFQSFQFSKDFKEQAAKIGRGNKINKVIPREPYIPLEKRTVQDNERFNKLRNNEILDYFGQGKKSLTRWKLAVTWEFAAKRKRQLYLNSAYKSRDVFIPVKRMRTYKDEYPFLVHYQKEIVVVIPAREDYPELQFIVDLKYMVRIYE